MPTDINFIKPKGQESATLIKARKITKAATTAILAAWIVVSAGFLGWWVFVKSKTMAVSNELQSLLTQQALKSEQEIIIRKLDLRAKSVQSWLDNRGDLIRKAEVLTAATPEAVAWKYDLGTDRQSVEIKTNSIDVVDSYLGSLKESYTNVQIDSLLWENTKDWTGWTADISVGGLNK